MDLSLAAAADLSTLTGLPEADPRVELGLRRASDRFRGAVGYPINRIEDDLVDLDGNGGQVLLLPAKPVHTITVTIDGTQLQTGVDFQINRRAGILNRPAGWPVGLGNIQVTYTHGWETIPGDIQDAVLEQAAIIATSLPHITSETAGSNQIGFGAEATIGVTSRWSETVAKYQVGSGDQS